jgi:LacI family transcriptional regulator
VSRVLNHEPNVREDTRRAVENAVAKLNYKPNPSARSLAGNKSYVIALMYDNPSGNYLMEIMNGVLDTCQAQHYNMVLCPVTFGSRDFARTVDDLLSHSRPDGLILTPPLTDYPALLERLAQLDIIWASVSPKVHEGGIGVTLDEHQAACEIVDYLVSLGHRRIAHIKGHREHGASEWRLSGYRAALKKAGLPYDSALVLQGEFTYDSGVVAARKLFALKSPPTAVFAANDDTAAGVIRVAYERGLSIPHDVSICGFDDTPMSRQIFPALTTVRQPCHDMGRVAATELLKAIKNRDAGSMVRMPYALQLRQSTGLAPA